MISAQTHIYAFSLLLHTGKNEKCYFSVIVERLASANVLLTEPHGGSSTFRPKFVLKTQWGKSAIVGVYPTCSFSSQSTLFSICHMPVAVDYSLADRFLPKSCGGNNSKETLKTTACKLP